MATAAKHALAAYTILATGSVVNLETTVSKSAAVAPVAEKTAVIIDGDIPFLVDQLPIRLTDLTGQIHRELWWDVQGRTVSRQPPTEDGVYLNRAFGDVIAVHAAANNAEQLQALVVPDFAHTICGAAPGDSVQLSLYDEVTESKVWSGTVLAGANSEPDASQCSGHRLSLAGLNAWVRVLPDETYEVYVPYQDSGWLAAISTAIGVAYFIVAASMLADRSDDSVESVLSKQRGPMVSRYEVLIFLDAPGVGVASSILGAATLKDWQSDWALARSIFGAVTSIYGLLMVTVLIQLCESAPGGASALRRFIEPAVIVGIQQPLSGTFAQVVGFVGGIAIAAIAVRSPPMLWLHSEEYSKAHFRCGILEVLFIIICVFATAPLYAQQALTGIGLRESSSYTVALGLSTAAAALCTLSSLPYRRKTEMQYEASGERPATPQSLNGQFEGSRETLYL